jgi:hypothetical protein
MGGLSFALILRVGVIALVIVWARTLSSRVVLAERGPFAYSRGAEIAQAKRTLRSRWHHLPERLDHGQRAKAGIHLLEMKTRGRDYVHWADAIGGSGGGKVLPAAVNVAIFMTVAEYSDTG